MNNVIKIITLALALVPQIIETVKAIEVPGNGTAKKDAVVSIVLAAIKTFAPDLGLKVETIALFANQVVDIVVTLLNASGVFAKKSA